MEKTPTFGVIGGGSWATAIVKMLSENLEEINWYMRSKTAIQHIKTHYHNPNYLSSVEFNVDQLHLSNDINEVVKNSDYLIFAIPSAFVKKSLTNLLFR